MKLFDDHYLLNNFSSPNAVCTTQQHLEGNVWNATSHLLQSLPRALVQESQADIKCGTSPILERVQVVEFVSDEWRNLQQVMCTNTRGQERLMSVTESRVHEKDILFCANCLGKGFWSLGLQDVSQAGWWCINY
jgi:hypothetical protein